MSIDNEQLDRIEQKLDQLLNRAVVEQPEKVRQKLNRDDYRAVLPSIMLPERKYHYTELHARLVESKQLPVIPTEDAVLVMMNKLVVDGFIIRVKDGQFRYGPEEGSPAGTPPRTSQQTSLKPLKTKTA